MKAQKTQVFFVFAYSWVEKMTDMAKKTSRFFRTQPIVYQWHHLFEEKNFLENA
jgi:hypothetical protein